MSFYLAIDLGTTGCRSILFDENLCQIGRSYEEYGLITPREGWTEQDANLWWQMTLHTAKEVITQTGIDSKAIRAISISSQGITVVPVDADLRPLCNALSWLDVRAHKQAAKLEEDMGRTWMFTHTGKPIDPCYTLPKLLWFKEHQPQIYAQAWKFLMPMDFLIAKFTGNCVTDHSMASGTLMYDIKNCRWSSEVLGACDIDPEKLPAIRWSGEIAGTVLPEVAARLDLCPDCVVAVGAQDQKCAALGAGLRPGTMTVSLGTAAAVTKLWHTPETETYTKTPWCGNTKEGTWVTEGVINTAGTCLRWIRDLMFRGESYDTINEEARIALEQNGRMLFYPYLNGPSSPDYYPDAQGCFYGMDLSAARGHFALAVMEGVAFQLRIMLEAMGAYGCVDQLVFFGGGANSPLWCQLIADITGLDIWVTDNPEAAGAGAAMLAAQAQGEAVSPLPCSRVYRSNGGYDEKYRRYRTIEAKLWKQEKS